MTPHVEDDGRIDWKLVDKGGHRSHVPRWRRNVPGSCQSRTVTWTLAVLYHPQPGGTGAERLKNSRRSATGTRSRSYLAGW
jgi:hypothetical protein